MIAPTITGDHEAHVSDYTGIVMTYQKVCGTLNPGGHPGSYNGQDAYNDLLVVEGGKNNVLRREWTNASGSTTGKDRSIELYARSTDGFGRGG